MSGWMRYKRDLEREDSAAPTFKRNPRADAGLPSEDYALAVDTPIAGPKRTWTATGLHIEDPRLADQPARLGSPAGCYSISWDEIERMRLRFQRRRV